jgi:hypothetical protein
VLGNSFCLHLHWLPCTRQSSCIYLSVIYFHLLFPIGSSSQLLLSYAVVTNTTQIPGLYNKSSVLSHVIQALQVSSDPAVQVLILHYRLQEQALLSPTGDMPSFSREERRATQHNDS